jgi:hypothetical protein
MIDKTINQLLRSAIDSGYKNSHAEVKASKTDKLEEYLNQMQNEKQIENLQQKDAQPEQDRDRENDELTSDLDNIAVPAQVNIPVLTRLYEGGRHSLDQDSARTIDTHGLDSVEESVKERPAANNQFNRVFTPLAMHHGVSEQVRNWLSSNNFVLHAAYSGSGLRITLRDYRLNSQTGGEILKAIKTRLNHLGISVTSMKFNGKQINESPTGRTEQWK